MMLMGLVPLFWLGLEGAAVSLPTVQKLGVGFQAAKRADAADGHAGTSLDYEQYNEETSTGLKDRVHPTKTGREPMRSSTVLSPAIHYPHGVTSALRAIAEAKNRPTTETQNHRNAERG